MGKKTSKKESNQQERKQPAFVEELLKNGTVTIATPIREEIDTMLNEIPTDVKYMAGAVGFNHDMGVFSLRLDITNN